MAGPLIRVHVGWWPDPILNSLGPVVTCISSTGWSVSSSATMAIPAFAPRTSSPGRQSIFRDFEPRMPKRRNSAS